MKQSTMQEGIDIAIDSVTLRRELKVVEIMKENGFVLGFKHIYLMF